MANVSEIPDRVLLDEFVRHGSDTAFAEIVRRHQAMAFATAFRICGDRTEAKDILQQALVVLARRAHELGEVKCVSAWLHRVVTLEAKKARKKSFGRRRRETMAYQINEISAETDEGFISNLAPKIDESLDAMGAKDREVLTLHYLEGLSFKAISKELGGSSESWQKRSARALQKLADKLRNRGVVVPTAALGAFLASTRAEAGIAALTLETMTSHAIEQGAKITATLGKTALLLTMKTGIAISLTSGVLLAYGWGTVSRHLYPVSAAKVAAMVSNHPGTDVVARRSNRDRGFSMELVREAVSEYDNAEKGDPLTESRLRSLMFLVPEIHLEDVFRILLGTKDHDRFQQIAAALFGCWAEFDPAAAFARSKNASDFSYQARRAVMMTWLNQDPDDAVALMLEEKSQENLNFLREFLVYKCERMPREAATLVDRLAEDWPEADRILFEKVATLWSRSDALAAGEWVASYHDDNVKNNLLKTIAVDVAKIRGFDGLAIANHIEDDEIRSAAREKAIYWWGVTSGGISLIPGKARPVRDLSGGFPPDWTSENIRDFSFATMVNYTRNLPDLLDIAKNDEQRILIYEGAIRGSGWSNPAAVREAAEALPDTFAQTPEGKRTLEVFIKRWNEMDSKGVTEWLSKQAPGPKTDAMKAGLKEKGGE